MQNQNNCHSSQVVSMNETESRIDVELGEMHMVIMVETILVQ